jgi:predicted DCC family thiol-disulfide oxidoreductase YuxK
MLNNNQNSVTKGWILYDGMCGACTYFVGEKADYFNKLGYETLPLQEISEKQSWIKDHFSITESDLYQEIHLVTANKRLLKGADVYREITRSCCLLYPFYIASKLPVLRCIYDSAYREISKRRMKISQVCNLERYARYPMKKEQQEI